MKTKVTIYHCDVERKLSLIALLKEPAIHAEVIADLEHSLITGQAYTRDFTIDAKVGE